MAKFRCFGYGEGDFEGGGSDRLIDALVAWGDADRISARVRAHLEAGADHVCVQVIGAEPGDEMLDRWRRLADVLLD